MIDEELNERKKDIIFENLDYLESKEFENPGFESVQAVKYSMQEVIEACLDIANHVIASRGIGRAEDYSEMFELLGEEGIIDEELAGDLADMAKFRNLLVHRYGDIRNEELRRILDEDLDNIWDYIEQIDQELFAGE